MLFTFCFVPCKKIRGGPADAEFRGTVFCKLYLGPRLWAAELEWVGGWC